MRFAHHYGFLSAIIAQQENLFLIRGVADAERQRRFSRDVTTDIRWILLQGRSTVAKSRYWQFIYRYLATKKHVSIRWQPFIPILTFYNIYISCIDLPFNIISLFFDQKSQLQWKIYRYVSR
ncbi:TPA: hypothetical protein MND73_004531 [Salmonella enterica subsp. houtenae]|nr:hypothetical protein [Salmonella enterica subsp. houtenae]